MTDERPPSPYKAIGFALIFFLAVVAFVIAIDGCQ